jgi:signal transduction histidine kinase
MLLAFAPLFIAVASLTHATLQGVRDDSARALGRAIAAHVSDARHTRSVDGLQNLLNAEIGGVGLDAIGVYDRRGDIIAMAGAGEVAAALPLSVPLSQERNRTIRTPHGRTLEVLVPGANGPVLALVRTDDEAVRARPLVGLVGLYTAAFAVALLAFAYMALTRLIVRPIDELSEGARRVAQGARSLEPPHSAARELSDLGANIADMTRQLRAEEEKLRTKIDELEKATSNLKRAQTTIIRSERLASVGKLAAGLAHEIGNPIAAIIGFQDLLLETDLEQDERRDFLVRMKRETERINRVLRQLLDFARPAAANRAADHLQPANVSDAIEHVAALVRPHKAMRDLKLEVSVQPNIALLSIDGSELEQVLLNLMLNGADAAGPNGILRIEARPTESGARIEVIDNGKGVSPDVRGSLFEPFVTTKEVGSGTGLGLAVCRGLVEAAGGLIGFEDSEVGGSVFWLELPKHQLRDGPSSSARPSSHT